MGVQQENALDGGAPPSGACAGMNRAEYVPYATDCRDVMCPAAQFAVVPPAEHPVVLQGSMFKSAGERVWRKREEGVRGEVGGEERRGSDEGKYEMTKYYPQAAERTHAYTRATIVKVRRAGKKTCAIGAVLDVRLLTPKSRIK